MNTSKNVGRAYWLAFVGLICGIVGIHRFYLERYYTGTLMVSLSASAILCLVVGLVHMDASIATAGDTQLQYHDELIKLAWDTMTSETPNHNVDENTKLWFASGLLLIFVTLCWLLLDCIFMEYLTRNRDD